MSLSNLFKGEKKQKNKHVQHKALHGFIILIMSLGRFFNALFEFNFIDAEINS